MVLVFITATKNAAARVMGLLMVFMEEEGVEFSHLASANWQSMVNREQ